jgi:hypothetical protein
MPVHQDISGKHLITLTPQEGVNVAALVASGSSYVATQVAFGDVNDALTQSSDLTFAARTLSTPTGSVGVLSASNGAEVSSLSSLGLITLNPTSGSNSLSISHDGGVGATAVSNANGYITILVNGVTKKIAFYT